MPSPLLLVHICAAVIGLASGSLSMIFRKGSGLHVVAGNAFFGSMLIMSSTGAVISTHPISRWNGILTFYLVVTGWLTARRRSGKPGAIDVAALLVVLVVTGALFTHGATARTGGAAGMFYIFAFVALLCAVSDIRMIARGGIFGAKRIARHLWRMSFAFLIAALSLFPGQGRLFPDALRKSGLMFLPLLLIAGTMVFWMFRVLWNRKKAPGNFPGAGPYTSPRTDP